MPQKKKSKSSLPKATKHDLGKPPISMIPYAALAEEAYAMGSGVAKYSKHNYMLGGGLDWSRPLDAALRHLMKFAQGKMWDEDNPSLTHLGCARAELGMLIHLIDEEVGRDDLLDYQKDSDGWFAEARSQKEKEG